MIKNAYHVIETAGGARVELDFRLGVYQVPEEGDNWNSPRIPAHIEVDDPDPYHATWYHPDGEWTEFTFSRGSLAWLFFSGILDGLSNEELVDCLPEEVMQ